jgi:hypothetical protein
MMMMTIVVFTGAQAHCVPASNVLGLFRCSQSDTQSAQDCVGTMGAYDQNTGMCQCSSCPTVTNVHRWDKGCSCSCFAATCSGHGSHLPDCSCACDDGWSGDACDSCTLRCRNSGFLHMDTCTCECALWKECGAHGSPTHSCFCDCEDGWSGPKCDECDLDAGDCQHGGVFDDDKCQCQCPMYMTGKRCNMPSTRIGMLLLNIMLFLNFVLQAMWP